MNQLLCLQGLKLGRQNNSIKLRPGIFHLCVVQRSTCKVNRLVFLTLLSLDNS